MLLGIIPESWRLLQPAERRQAIAVTSAVLGGMMLEMLGLGLVVPAIGLMLREDWREAHPRLTDAVNALGNPTQTQVIIGGLLTLLGVYVIKSGYLVWMLSFQFRFVHRVEAGLSVRMLTTYLHRPWTFHLQRNSAELIRNTTSEVATFTNVLSAVVNLFTDVLITAGIVAVLVFTEPMATLVIALCFLVGGSVFLLLLRKKVADWAIRRHNHDAVRMRFLQEGLGAVREVLLLGRVDHFASRFAGETVALSDVNRKYAVSQQLPRIMFELLSLVSIALVIGMMFAGGRSGPQILPSIALFAAAALRLMPAASRIVASLQWMRWGRPSVALLRQELSADADDAPVGRRGLILGVESLEARDVRFRYPGATSDALQGIDMQIQRGSTTGIIGASGSGKSTLLDIMLGLLSPSAGQVRVNGIDVREDLRGWQDQIGYVPQSIYLSDESLRRNVALGVPEQDIDDAAVWRALQSARLDALVGQWPEGVNTTVGERGVRLSGGQRQRIGIARALYSDPDVLVLDEATSALDNETEREVMDTIRSLHGRKTVVIVAHRLSTVRHCDTIYRLETGRVVARGSFEQVVFENRPSGQEPELDPGSS